jgi:hypothetical protein
MPQGNTLAFDALRSLPQGSSQVMFVLQPLQFLHKQIAAAFLWKNCLSFALRIFLQLRDGLKLFLPMAFTSSIKK